MRRGRSHQEPGAAASQRRRLAFAFTALFAVILQAFVVQTHVHGSVAPVTQGYERAARSGDDDAQHVSAAGEHQAVCSLCQALAATGAATLPSAGSPIDADLASTAAVIALSLAPRLHSHSWRSRAPPSFL